MEELDRAYLAGVLDGEGSIMLMKRRSNEFPAPVVSIVSTDKELIDWLQSIFHGQVVKKKTYQDHHKPSYDWRVTNRRALDLLELIEPFLKIERKKNRARFLLTEYVKCTPRNGKYTDEMLQQKNLLSELWIALG